MESGERDLRLATTLGFLHDLRNLLGPLIAYAALARDHTEAAGAAHRYVLQVLNAAERARALSERLLRRMRETPEPLKRVILVDVVRDVASWLRAENPRLEVVLEPPLSAKAIRGDALGLEQMVFNLCKNAVEALPPEGGRISLALREIDSPRELRLAVRDNGRGMDEAVLARIWEPFFSTKPGGTGLGLATARDVVRRHRGTITIESSVGSGTTFLVRLPPTSRAAASYGRASRARRRTPRWFVREAPSSLWRTTPSS